MDSDAVADLIDSERALLLAGDETLLASLPRGRWIGGTSPYFLIDGQGVTCRDKVFVTELPVEAGSVSIRSYGTDGLAHIGANAPENGFTVLLIPAFSAVHSAYAQGIFGIEGAFNMPVVGWVTGIALDEVGRATPKVFDGSTGTVSDSMALAMHVPLPPDCAARIGIVNPFRPGGDDVIAFEEAGFEAGRCTVNGRPEALLPYLRARGIDGRQPLVADCFGTAVNVSIREIDEAAGVVRFYAPVFPGLRYRLAVDAGVSPGQDGTDPAFACACVLNGTRERHAADYTGPMTFGEIAYMLLNQTIVYLTVEPTA